MQYLLDGNYLDTSTRQLTAEMLTYNADLQVLGYTRATFDWQRDGAIKGQRSPRSAQAGWFTWAWALSGFTKAVWAGPSFQGGLVCAHGRYVCAVHAMLPSSRSYSIQLSKGQCRTVEQITVHCTGISRVYPL